MNVVTAIMHVRNEQHILPLSAAYLLNELKVDRLVIADNGSTDATVDILRRLATLDERVRWTDASGPYAQAEIVTELAREVSRWGTDWILPSDADEFFWFAGKPFPALDWPRKTGVLQFDVRNFVQWSWVRHDHARSIETMVFSANPVNSGGTAQGLVESGAIAFVEIVYPPKLIMRASAEIKVHKGNHGVEGVEGERLVVGTAKVLHAPLRGHDALSHRLAVACRLDPKAPAGESWHLRRLLGLQQAGRLEQEWRANSNWCGRIGPAKHKRWLRFDLRLRQIALRQRAFAQKLLAGIQA